MKTRIVLSILLVVLLASTLVQSQERFAIRNAGMARASTASSRGLDAVGVNPANLAVKDRGYFSLGLGRFGLRLGSEFFNYGIYQDYFTGETDSTGNRVAKYLSEVDKKKLLDEFPDEISQIRFNFESMLAGITYRDDYVGGFAASVIERAGAIVSLDKEYMRLLLFQLDSSGSDYNFTGSGLEAWWWQELNFSYAHRIPIKLNFPKDIYLGFGVKLINGFGVFQTQYYNARLANIKEDLNQYRLHANFDYLLRRSGIDVFDTTKEGTQFEPFNGAGKGTGFDFGLSMDLVEGIRVGVALTDNGKITWDKNIVEMYGSYQLNVTGYEDAKDSVMQAIKGKNRTGETFTTLLPTRLRAGIEFNTSHFKTLEKYLGSATIAFDVSKGMNESFGNSQKLRLAGGFEWRLLRIVPLRTGFAINEAPGVFHWSFGTGIDLHFLTLDLATEDFHVLFIPRQFRQFTFAMGLKLIL